MTTTNRPIGPTITPVPWLDRLAMLGADLRPDWDRTAIRAQLARVSDRPLAHVAGALLAACQQTDQPTPAVIAHDGPHWHTSPPDAPADVLAWERVDNPGPRPQAPPTVRSAPYAPRRAWER